MNDGCTIPTQIYQFGIKANIYFYEAIVIQLGSSEEGYQNDLACLKSEINSVQSTHRWDT